MKTVMLCLCLICSFTTGAVSNDDDTILVTVFLKHDQSKNLGEIKEILSANDFYAHFPPKGTQVVSWHVMMGIGQVITLKIRPEQVPAVNLAIERFGWKAYRSEFYLTYDLYPVVKPEIEKAQGTRASSTH